MFVMGCVSCIPIWERVTGSDLSEIRARGTLQVVTAYSANSYFIYRGQPMGFEYELLKRLADDIGVQLEIIVTTDMDNITYMLNSGRGDLVAANIAVTKQRSEEVRFTEYLMLTRQVLVQRSPGYVPAALAEDLERSQSVHFVRDPIELIGERVHVRRGSVFYQRLHNLEEEVGGEIKIATVPGDVVTEELIRMVNSGEIDYTVADEPTALINRAYYTGLDVSVPISFSQRIAWITHRNAPEFLEFVNDWIRRIRQDGTLATIHRRYYEDPRGFVQRVESEYYSATGSRLSTYDEYIKTAAGEIDWDWLLLASLMYQESRFNPNARSWAGATGLMQLMPATGRSMGATNLNDPVQNIRAGSRYLAQLEENWAAIEPREERLKFVLASYNAGPGHVADARLLAEHFGKNPNIWDGNVADYMLRLSNPEYYNDYGVQYGYCRGEEPFNYVREILERYEQYRELIREEGEESGQV